jgi:transposase
MDTMNKSGLAKRGHCKHKRKDLRIVGLSLMVSPDFSIPLLHEAYPGNDGDAKEFKVMVKRLKERYDAITKTDSDVTIVFDRGNNSEENIELLESGELKLHYVGGLKKNQATELYEIALSEYTPLDSPSLEGNSAYRREMKIFGRDLTVVIVHNPELEKGQMQGIMINQENTDLKMRSLQNRLSLWASGDIKKGRRPTAASVTKAVDKFLSGEYMDDIFSYEVFERDGNIYLIYSRSDEKLGRLRELYLGKTVLFTDRKEYSNEQIVSSYRSAWHVESAFKQMKDTHHLTVRPIFHWTDEKIRVHIFTCVLAYRLCCLLVKELHGHGINISINRMMDSMSDIKRVYTFYGDINKPKKIKSFSIGGDLGKQIEEIYKLKEKYS